MIDPARCARHPAAAASITCPRCGSFVCTDCERRAALDSPPMCPACWALAAASSPPEASSGTGLQTAGLVLGVFSFIPFCFIHLASIVVNTIAIAKATSPAARAARWRPIIGLALTLTFGLLQVLFVAFYNFFSSARG